MSRDKKPTRAPEELAFSELAEWMYDYAFSAAEKIVRQTTLSPVVLALQAAGGIDMFVCGGLSKDETARMLGALAESPDYRIAAFVCESWMQTNSTMTAEQIAQVDRGEKTLGDFAGSRDAVLMHFRGAGGERWAFCNIEEGRRLKRGELMDPSRQAVHGRFFAPPGKPN